MKKKHLHTQKNPRISTEGAYSKLLPTLFVMPQSTIMEVIMIGALLKLLCRINWLLHKEKKGDYDTYEPSF